MEDTGILKALLFNKIHELRKILLRFAGKADDKGGADGDARNAAAQLVEQLFNLSTRIRAVHAVKQTVAGMLQRNINIFANLFAFSEGSNELIIKVVRIEVHHANPLNALQLIQVTQQLRQHKLAV